MLVRMKTWIGDVQRSMKLKALWLSDMIEAIHVLTIQDHYSPRNPAKEFVNGFDFFALEETCNPPT